VSESDEENFLQPPAENWADFITEPLVLIVEDNEEMRYYLKKILDGKVKLAEAENGREALSWLEKNNPDLIISDIMMPEMDGRELMVRVKNNKDWRKIPVIMISALADPENEMGMLRLGIDDYIVKPFNPAELRIRAYNLLKNLIERKAFNEQQPEADDVPVDSIQGDEFRNKIEAFVLARIKNTNVSVSELAFELSLSERQLFRLAKSLTGYSPAQLIKEVRLKKAYEILVTGQVTKIEDLAKRVGFENPGYFSRQFMNRFGKRPTEFL
jgi:YesN/AraC family two-component response regulator